MHMITAPQGGKVLYTKVNNLVLAVVLPATQISTRRYGVLPLSCLSLSSAIYCFPHAYLVVGKFIIAARYLHPVEFVPNGVVWRPQRRHSQDLISFAKHVQTPFKSRCARISAHNEILDLQGLTTCDPFVEAPLLCREDIIFSA